MTSLGSVYWRLWSASGLSNLADGIVKVALGLVAVQFTRSPSLVAGLAAVSSLPWLVFALHAGVLADRVDRRRAMLAANLVRAALVAVLAAAIALGFGSIWLLYVVALGLGIAETVHDTAAQAILPQIVGRDRLTRANSRLFAAELTANEFAGPPLGGFLVAAGASVAFAAPSALWIVALAALFFVPGSFRADRPQGASVREDLVEGLRFLWENRILRILAIMVGGFNFATSAVITLFVLYAVGPSSAMGLSEQAYGFLLAVIALGSLAGSFVAERIELALGRSRALVLSLLTGAAFAGIPAVTTDPYVIGAVFFLGGAGVVLWNVIVVSLRQRIIPDHLLGRATSGHRLVAWGTKPLGAAAAGLLAEVFGLRPVFAGAAAVILALLPGLRVLTNERPAA
ncbi:MFS transporter [Amycolatopsis keratiniphila]|uniref:MFS transporter n=1 Tax=Amycolatopsis keratiniphila TaxID=129921 RepID=UPI0008799440|nr:MFS transporter [Amycolatopsis keratiniphila]SDU46122.1 Predicted arabinose efflux permease, MFS family [Amycolatopsis keratiniphila]